MKGKTTCPKCCNEFVVDVPENLDKTNITCPICNHLFVIKRQESNQECGWEEHGEPRKTILSSIKKKTNRPIIASFLLLATGVLGIFTSIILFSNNGSIISDLGFIKSYFSDYDNIILSFVIIVCSIFALIGSFLSFKRRLVNFVIICSILGIFSLGLFFGSIISIAALILLVLSRDEFENASKGKIF